MSSGKRQTVSKRADDNNKNPNDDTSILMATATAAAQANACALAYSASRQTLSDSPSVNSGNDRVNAFRTLFAASSSGSLAGIAGTQGLSAEAFSSLSRSNTLTRKNDTSTTNNERKRAIIDVDDDVGGKKQFKFLSDNHDPQLDQRMLQERNLSMCNGNDILSSDSHNYRLPPQTGTTAPGQSTGDTTSAAFWNAASSSSPHLPLSSSDVPPSYSHPSLYHYSGRDIRNDVDRGVHMNASALAEAASNLNFQQQQRFHSLAQAQAQAQQAQEMMIPHHQKPPLPLSLPLSLLDRQNQERQRAMMMFNGNIGGTNGGNLDHLVQPTSYPMQQHLFDPQMFLESGAAGAAMNILQEPFCYVAAAAARSALLQHGYTGSDIEMIQKIINNSSSEEQLGRVQGRRIGQFPRGQFGEGGDPALLQRALQGHDLSVDVLGDSGGESQRPPSVNQVLLALPEDTEKLSEQQCFIRKQIEAFTASHEDISTHTRGRNKPIVLDQVGIRCIHCSSLPIPDRGPGAVYFPSSLGGVYQAAQNIQKYHLRKGCQSMPSDLLNECNEIISCKSNLGGGKQYWTDAARELGMVDTRDGIRFQGHDSYHLQNKKEEDEQKSRLLSQSASAELLSTASPNVTDSASGTSNEVVQAEDRSLISDYLYVLLCQVRPCRLSDADRVGYRKDQDLGLPGLECKHCGGVSGGCGGGRFFRSTAASIAKNENMTQIYKHMKNCKACPDEVKISLNSLKQLHIEQVGNLKRGWKKIFFERVMRRLCNTSKLDDDNEKKENKEE